MKVSRFNLRLPGEVAMRYTWTQSSEVGAELELAATTWGQGRKTGGQGCPRERGQKRGRDKGGEAWMK